MQHPVHVRLVVQARNHIDTPPVNPTHCQTRTSIYQLIKNISNQQRTSSCTSTTPPTSATHNNRPAAPIYDSTDISYPSSCFSSTSTIPATDIIHLAEDANTTTTNFTHALVITTINCHLCYICHLAFVSFIVFWLSLLARSNLNHLQGRRAYRLCNNPARFELNVNSLLKLFANYYTMASQL